MIKSLLISIIISSVFLIVLVEVVPFNPTEYSYAQKQGDCKILDSLWEHTYGAGKSHWSPGQTHSRLLGHTPACVVFDGKIRGTPTTEEHDGDLTFNVDPDGTAPNENWKLLNVNNTGHGLHIEIICWEKPSSSYTNKFGDYCKGVDTRTHIPTLKASDHVRITGKWVKDIGYPQPDHVEWNEIHPVESIQKLP